MYIHVYDTVYIYIYIYNIHLDSCIATRNPSTPQHPSCMASPASARGHDASPTAAHAGEAQSRRAHGEEGGEGRSIEGAGDSYD